MDNRKVFFDMKNSLFGSTVWNVVIPYLFHNLDKTAFINEADIIIMDDIDKLFECHGRYLAKRFGFITDDPPTIELPSNIVIIQIGAVTAGLMKLFG